MDTPITDANAFATEYALVKEGTELVLAGFARQLERELAAEQEKVRELREALRELHRFSFEQHGLSSAWVAPLNAARAILEKSK